MYHDRIRSGMLVHACKKVLGGVVLKIPRIYVRANEHVTAVPELAEQWVRLRIGW